MSDDHFEFSDSAIMFLGDRMPVEMIKVFIVIWQEREKGVRHKELVEVIGDRYIVERSLLFLETIGFILPQKKINMKNKYYMPHHLRGYQLAKFIMENRQNKVND